jgi:hypothetical protein
MSSCCSSGSAMHVSKCSSRDLPYSAGGSTGGGGLAVAAVAAAAGITAGGAGGPAVWVQQQHHLQLSTASPFCSMTNQLQQLPGAPSGLCKVVYSLAVLLISCVLHGLLFFKHGIAVSQCISFGCVLPRQPPWNLTVEVSHAPVHLCHMLK